MAIFKRILFSLFFSAISFIVYWCIFNPIYYSEIIIISFAVHPFNICEDQPLLWNIIKNSSVIFYLFSNLILFIFISTKIIRKKRKNKIKKIHNNQNGLTLLVGKDLAENEIYIPEKSLYQNILITGTIGSGKTSSAMYPFTKQLIEYKSNNTNEKLGMLILDVKGNYYLQVKKYVSNFQREDDLIVLDLSGNIKFNPLHKPNLKASVLANRLKTILLLFSPNNTESFWLDKVEQILSECIKLCRLYNNGYVTFEELHNLVVIPNYYEKKNRIIKKLILSKRFFS